MRRQTSFCYTDLATGLVTAPERIQRVHTLICLAFPPDVATLIFWRFGSQRRLFLLCAWLTLLPVIGPFPHIAHTLAIFILLITIHSYFLMFSGCEDVIF